ncbi:MAG: mechanosensitive ion channel [Balneolaceae bacterium]|nr:mechanosensitive ion channel [Balneolaceae bacterium]
MENVDALSSFVAENLVFYGMQVIGAVAILIVGWLASKWAGRRVITMSESSGKIDETVGPLLGKITRIAVLAVTVLAVLGQFGVETASLIAVLGTIGLAIGLALQGTLSNIASGMMLLSLRPFSTGDAVEIGGTSGVVDEIGLFVTRMHSFDNKEITVPNSRIWGSEIINMTGRDTRRCDLEIGIGYDDDIDKAMRIIGEVLAGEERVLDEPEPLIAVGALGDNAVVLRVRPWTRTPDLWPLRYDLIKAFKQRFDAEGISFPYPQRDVHLFREGE